MKIKKIFNYYQKFVKPGPHPNFLFPSPMSIPIPPDEEGTYPIEFRDFMNEYVNAADYFDKMFARRFANCEYDPILEDCNSEKEYLESLQDVFRDCLFFNLRNWKRLYYATWLKYNPIWNVDGTTIHEFSEQENTDIFGEKEINFEKGQQIDQDGATQVTSTEYSTAYDSIQEKEDGKTVDVGAAVTNTSGQRSDSTTEGEHSDSHIFGEHEEKEIRSGNIGVTMTQQLLEAEWEFRKKSFWNVIFDAFAKEAGLFYKSF